MKYLSLPIHLLKFWYFESLEIFFTTWKHLLTFLEEDLAVGLMFRLLFVPLFHDATIFGRVLSFCFRSVRVIIGASALFLMSTLLLLITVIWLLAPPLSIFLTGTPALIFRLLVFSGIGLFLIHSISRPHKKLVQVKKIDDLWQSSFVKKDDLDFSKLLKTYQVKNLLLYLEQVPDNFTQLKPTANLEAMAQKVWEIALKSGANYLGPEHFFVAEITLIPNIEKELIKLQLKPDDFTLALEFLERKSRFWRVVYPWDDDFKVRHLKGVNRGWLGVPTPNLDSVSEDLTRIAAKTYVPDFIGRQEQVKRVINILSLEKGQNVALIGEPGSGRGALISYLAKLIISGDAPPALATKRIVTLDVGRLLAGITSEGDLSQRLKDVFEEVKYCGNIVVYVSEVENLGIGEAGDQFNMYALMLPYLESSDFQFVAVADSASYAKTVEKNKSLARLFTKVELPPATVEETIDILKNHSINAERYKKIRSSLIALKQTAELAHRYLHDLVLPDGAIKVFEECLVSAKDGWVKKEIVEKVIQDRTSLPMADKNPEAKKELLNLEEIIHQKLIDQTEAVSDVAKTLRRAATDLRDQNRPIGSFLFVGPTGVGKTELAKTLVDTYFEGKGHFARFDMSEYQNSESVNRLIGGPEEEGLLTEEIRLHPYSLILLDEFEKADPKILTLFLQVLDDGRLTSGSGKTVDFTSTIIIATSNAASLTIAQGLEKGQSMEELKKVVRDELLKIFKPELINRFDDVVIFKPLSPDDLQKVVRLKLVGLQNQLKEQGYEVEFDEKLIQEIAQKGYDPVLGARPLRRLIQDTLEARLSTMILEDKLLKGEKFIASGQLLN